MAHVDDTNAFIDAAVIDIDDVPAAECEYRVHPLVLQRLGDQMSAGNDAGVAGFPLERVFRGRGTPAGVRSLGRRLEHGLPPSVSMICDGESPRVAGGARREVPARSGGYAASLRSFSAW